MQHSYHRCSYSTAGELEESPWQTSTDPAVFSKCSLTTFFSFCSPFYLSLTNTTKTAREKERDSYTPALPRSKTLFLTHTFELWMLHTQVERWRAELILKGTLLTAHSFIHNHLLPQWTINQHIRSHKNRFRLSHTVNTVRSGMSHTHYRSIDTLLPSMVAVVVQSLDSLGPLTFRFCQQTRCL